MIVLKFGGTSVGSAQAMAQTLDITAAVLDQAPVLVSSAMTKVTDSLIKCLDLVEANDPAAAKVVVDSIWQRHSQTAQALLGSQATTCCLAIDDLARELHSIIRGLGLIREVSPRSRDMVLSFGERLSTLILFHAAQARGLSVALVDARAVVKTDDHFTSANILSGPTAEAIRSMVVPKSGHLIVSQGFLGSTLDGITTTLGRGGSDYSATIFGAALGASEVQIWTDVDGIMTTDPRLVPEARVIESIAYDEAAELAYFGAKVIHPSTIQPAVEQGIPVWVKNTFNPTAPGTKINRETTATGLRAIAGKKHVNVVTVRSSRMLQAHGFLRSIFQVFENHRVSVDLIATSEVSVSMTIDDASHLPALRRDLAAFAEVDIEERQSIISLVGRDLWKDSAFVSRVFSALAGIQIRLISLGSSDINLSLVVAQDDLEAGISRLHRELF